MKGIRYIPKKTDGLRKRVVYVRLNMDPTVNSDADVCPSGIVGWIGSLFCPSDWLLSTNAFQGEGGAGLSSGCSVFCSSGAIGAEHSGQ